MSLPGSDDSEGRLADLIARIELLEAERECRSLVAMYAYGADYDDAEAWLDLFTPDAVVDTVSFYGADPADPQPGDFRPNVMQGREQLRTGLIKGPQSAAMADWATQHHMSGNMMSVEMADAETLEMTTYGIVYGKSRRDTQPRVTYQNHTTNRWTFRRIDGRWRIAKLVRRRMGDGDGARLIHGHATATPDGP